jgi:Arc/MetJ family transcription regulator
MHQNAISMHMKKRRTTLILDDELLERAQELTGIKEKTSIVHEGLRTLIRLESARRLIALGGSQPKMKRIPRRRSRLAR